MKLTSDFQTYKSIFANNRCDVARSWTLDGNYPLSHLLASVITRATRERTIANS